ncbi:transmembrane protein 253 [Megalops cyprinoides]|uniref:transmembrane protein 253 n=1 Tax=Megalops cyprinoides TaxID=118141 RepID=UPI001863D6A6|nr:transmembrane protein 253 [Megalops cyprinoides]
MSQNMFQEGLYQVFFRERPLPRPVPVSSTPEQLREVRISRWFGTVVNTRLLITGVVQVLGAVASILTTVSFVCMDFGCSVSMMTPVWCGIFYVAIGGFAIEVQRKPNKVKVSTLMGLNIFSLILGFCAVLTHSLHITTQTTLSSREQWVGAYVAKGSSIFFTLQCVLASAYTLFLIWRGLSRYSTPYRQSYCALPQGGEEQSDLLLSADSGDFSL